MVAIPLLFIVQRDQEQVGGMELFEQSPAVRASYDGIAKVSVKPFQNGGLEQEALYLFRLPVEHLLCEIGQNESMAAAQPGNELRWRGPHRGVRWRWGVRRRLQGNRGELQSDDPPFGLLLQYVDVCFGQREVHHVVQVAGGIAGVEAQIAGADLGHLIVGAQSRHR